MTPPLRELHVVYLSLLAPGSNDDATFADIREQARARNPERGIAGVLLFDGRRFLHWVPSWSSGTVGAAALDAFSALRASDGMAVLQRWAV